MPTPDLSVPALRVARVSGVLGIVIPMVGLVVYPIWSFPDTNAGGSGIVAFVTDHQDQLKLMMALYTVGVTLWLAFGAAVWSLLRERLGTSPLPLLFAAGSIGYVTLLLAGFTAFDVLVYRPPTAHEAQLLYDLTFGLLAMSGMPTALALGAFAAAAYGSDGLVPRATAHLAAVAAAAHVLLLLAFVVPDGPLSLEGFSITGIPALLWAWILATALTLRPGERRAEATAGR